MTGFHLKVHPVFPFHVDLLNKQKSEFRNGRTMTKTSEIRAIKKIEIADRTVSLTNRLSVLISVRFFTGKFTAQREIHVILN